MVRLRLPDFLASDIAIATACRFAVFAPCFLFVLAYCFPEWNSLMFSEIVALLDPRFMGMV